MKTPEDSKQYTVLGNIAEYITNRYQITGQRTQFPNAVMQLYAEGLTVSERPPFSPADHLLSTEEFIRHIYSMPVDCSGILNGFDYSQTTENLMFPMQHGIHVMVNLPCATALMHAHEHLGMYYVYKGSCTQLFEDETKKLTEGSFVLLPPHTKHCVLPDPDSLIIVINIRRDLLTEKFIDLVRFENEFSIFLRRSMTDSLSQNYLLMHLEPSHHLHYILQTLCDLSYTDDAGSQDLAVILISQFFLLVNRNYSDTIEIFHPLYAQSASIFPLILKYTEEHSATVTLKGLSEIFHYRESYLSHLFKKNLGQTFTAVLRNARMNHAVKYLTQTNYKISEISVLTGYGAQEAFTRAFLRVYGVTPAEYRRRQPTS